MKVAPKYSQRLFCVGNNDGPVPEKMMRDPNTKYQIGNNDQQSDSAPSQESSPVRAGSAKFTFASGARPLDGFTIKRGIGIGGFGEVYFATSDAGKEVALKRIQRNLDVELRGVGQCLNLKHFNLVSLFDIKYDQQERGWVVMEYVNGESLKDVLDRNPNGMPPEEVCQWFDGISAGVAYLHDHGIVHRDLKPGNIFTDDDVVKIGDYGLSKFISCSRRSGHTESVGTFHYMAPEIGKGVYGKEIDIYALGIILYEMRTGCTPFNGESSQEIIMKHLTDDPDLSGINEPLRSVIGKALAKDPQQRYRNVAEMRHALLGDHTGSPTLKVFHNHPNKTDKQEKDHSPSQSDAKPENKVAEVITAQAVPDVSPVSVNKGPFTETMKNSSLYCWWNDAYTSAPVKTLLLICVAMGVMFITLNSPWIFPIALLLGMFYLAYWTVKSLVYLASEPFGSRDSDKSKVSQPNWGQHLTVRSALADKAPADRLSELTGSMLLSAFVAAVICLVMIVVGGLPLDAALSTWTLYTWLTLTSVAGSWIVLGLGKIWEGSYGENVRRRFVLLVAGLVLGLVSFALSNFLLVHWNNPDVAGKAAFEHAYPQSLFASNGSPELPAFLIFFAGLMAIMKWWKQADPLRPSRLNIWVTIGCLFWAWILPFPQPWGFMLAATISIAVQLSAPWIGPKQRAYLNDRYREA